MFWSKIKAALNSTLGTSGFKPLDKIIEDGFGEVSKIQKDIKETADTTLQNLKSGENEYVVKMSKMGATIVTGSYVGTAQNYLDDDYKNSLTFDFEPKVLIIIPPFLTEKVSYKSSTFRELVIFARPMKQGYQSSNDDGPIKLEWGEKSVTWWSTDKVVNRGSDGHQLNSSKRYYYIALG